MLNYNLHLIPRPMAEIWPEGSPPGHIGLWSHSPAISAHRCSGLLTPVLRTPGGLPPLASEEGPRPGSGRPRRASGAEGPNQGRPDIVRLRGYGVWQKVLSQRGGGLQCRRTGERTEGGSRGEEDERGV